MKTIFRIYTRDVQRICRNFFALVTVIGVCLIPSLYAWCNIIANMDPYSNTSGIPVAVVSNDQGAYNSLTGSVNVGESIVDGLRENDKLGWVFCTEEEAINGVRAGDYYAALVIPENFSAELLSILSGEIGDPTIDYYLNEKANAIAPKVTDAGASAIQGQLNSTFLSVATEAVVELIEDAAGQATEDLSDMERDLHRQLSEIIWLLSDDGQAAAPYESSYVLLDRTDTLLAATRSAAADGQQSLADGRAILASCRTELAAFSDDADDALARTEDTLSALDVQALADIDELDRQVRRTTDYLDSAIYATEDLTKRTEDVLARCRALAEKLPFHTQLADAIETLQAENERQRRVLSELEGTSTALQNAVDDLDDLSDMLSKTIRDTGQAIHDQRTDLTPELEQRLDDLEQAFDTLELCLTEADRAAEELQSLTVNLRDCLEQTRTAVNDITGMKEELTDQLRDVQTDLDAILSSQAYQDVLALTHMDAEQAADFMSAPIELETQALFPVENYGSGMTPFFSNLAIWVSGIVLITVFKLEVDRDEKIRSFTTTQSYLGRWLLFISVGLIQALIICLGDIFLMKVQCVHPGALIGAGLVTSLVYVNLIYTLALTFKHVGKALCVVLVILQIPGSSGTFPIEMTPLFFQRLHPFLPFSYSVGAMRESIAGMYGNIYVNDLCKLLIFLLVGLFIGLCVRPLLVNLNRMFDRRLGETGLMLCEEYGTVRSFTRLERVLRVLAKEPESREAMLRRAERFRMLYRSRVRTGFLLLILVPVVLCVLMFSINAKLVLLVLWILAIIAVVVYLLCIAYIRDNLEEKERLLGLSREELLKTVQTDDGKGDDDR